jgi:hypothetical protein
MGFGKPFRATPVRLGPYYKARQRRKSLSLVAKVLGAAVVAGLAIGVAAREGGIVAPYYPQCAAARAAGVAPLRIGEPGYRPELDADSDGIACEPYHRLDRFGGMPIRRG